MFSMASPRAGGGLLVGVVVGVDRQAMRYLRTFIGGSLTN
jgi:hypothetical protein